MGLVSWGVMSDVTRILSQVDQGVPHAADQLLPLVYDELRQLAALKMAQERPGLTLQATALVHEAYLRLVDVKQAEQWNSRRHFFAAAAEAMRRILIEDARHKSREKRGGGLRRLDLDRADLLAIASPDELLLLDETISGLAADDPAAGELVKLRYFSGLTVEEAGKALGLSRATAYRHWNYARAWLQCEMRRATDSA